jgi:hypothetical protein
MRRSIACAVARGKGGRDAMRFSSHWISLSWAGVARRTRQLRKRANQLPIEAPNDSWPLRFIASQLFILWPLDHRDSLVFR